MIVHITASLNEPYQTLLLNSVIRSVTTDDVVNLALCLERDWLPILMASSGSGAADRIQPGAPRHS